MHIFFQLPQPKDLPARKFNSEWAQLKSRSWSFKSLQNQKSCKKIKTTFFTYAHFLKREIFNMTSTKFFIGPALAWLFCLQLKFYWFFAPSSIKYAAGIVNYKFPNRIDLSAGTYQLQFCQFLFISKIRAYNTNLTMYIWK